MDIHTVFLKEYAVQVHSKACFEASFCPLLLHCRYLSTIDSPPHAPAPLPLTNGCASTHPPSRPFSFPYPIITNSNNLSISSFSDATTSISGISFP